MLKLGFRRFKPIFLKITFLVATFFLYLCLPVWVDICIINIWRQKGKSISKTLPQVRNPVVCAKLPITQFIDKFLKFKEMDYLIHHIKVEMWPALRKFLILFSAVKLKLSFVYILDLGCTSKFFPIHKETENCTFEYCSSWNSFFFSHFSQFMEKK